MQIKDNAYLSDIQTRILEYRMRDYSIVEMALKECCSESKISYELKKLDVKVKRVAL